MAAARGARAVAVSAPPRRAPLRPVRRPVRPRDADAGARRARGGVDRGARRRGLPRRARARCCATSPAARRRSTTPRRLSEAAGHRVYLKREDLLHTGAHKINNALGQCLLARRMGKQRIIAETGAGQHGVATATACALLGLECVVYMGTEDMRRQAPNVQRMELLGATRRAGRRRRADAQGGGVGGDPRLGHQRRRHALRDRLVRRPGAVPGARARPPAGDRRRGARADARGAGRLPDRVIACVGGGSNAIGMFVPFVDDADVALIGVEAGGRRDRHRPPRRAADRRRPRRRAARRLLGDHAGRGRPDPRGALDLGRPRLPRHRPRARAPARHRPRPLRRGHRRAKRSPRCAASPSSRASSRRSSPRTRSRGRWAGRRRGDGRARSTSSASPAAATRTSRRCFRSSASVTASSGLGADRRGVRGGSGPRGADAVPDGRLPGPRGLDRDRRGVRRRRRRPRRARRAVLGPARRRAR